MEQDMLFLGICNKLIPVIWFLFFNLAFSMTKILQQRICQSLLKSPPVEVFVTNLLMGKLCMSSKPTVPFLFLKAAVLAQLKIPTLPLTSKLSFPWSVLEASGHADQTSIWDSWFLMFPLLLKYPILLLILNQLLKPNLLRQYQTTGKEKWGRKRTWQCSQVPQRRGVIPHRDQVQLLENACIAKWQRPHNGGKGQWDRRPFAMHVAFVTGLDASFQSTVPWQVPPSLSHCTQTLTRRWLRWEARLVWEGQEWPWWKVYHHPVEALQLNRSLLGYFINDEKHS